MDNKAKDSWTNNDKCRVISSSIIISAANRTGNAKQKH